MGKFGLHDGGAQDSGLLNEKWESLALVPVLSDDHKKVRRGGGKNGGKHGGGGGDDDCDDNDDTEDYFLFSLSDNDFRALDGKPASFS